MNTTYKVKAIFINVERYNADRYNIIERMQASFILTNPCGMGLYDFEIISDLISEAWFNEFEAAFNIDKHKLAGNIVFQNTEYISYLPK